MFTHDAKYKEWVAGLKEGDEVAYDNSPSYSRTPYWAITKVKNVTPQGYIRLENKDLINRQGKQKTSENAYWIYPPTDTIRESIERNRLLRVVGRTEWSIVPTSVLQQIEKAIEEERNGRATISRDGVR